MLTFNLSQSDHVALHTRITLGHLAPNELARMSSTDRVSEEVQASMKQTAADALAHSILQTMPVPRAKFTRNGLEELEIDDVLPCGQAREAEDEQSRERERERLERLLPPEAGAFLLMHVAVSESCNMNNPEKKQL